MALESLSQELSETQKVSNIEKKYSKIKKYIGRATSIGAVLIGLTFGGLACHKSQELNNLQKPAKVIELAQTRAHLNELYRASETLEKTAENCIGLDFPFRYEDFRPQLEREIDYTEERINNLARLPEVKSYQARKKSLEAEYASISFTAGAGLGILGVGFLLSLSLTNYLQRKELKKIPKTLQIKDKPKKVVLPETISPT